MLRHSTTRWTIASALARRPGQAGRIELYALGVGLDLSAYYRQSLELDLSRCLDNAVFDEILRLLNGRN